MSIGAHCIAHCKMLVGKERPATLYQTSPHIFFEPVDTTFVTFLAYWRMKAAMPSDAQRCQGNERCPAMPGEIRSDARDARRCQER